MNRAGLLLLAGCAGASSGAGTGTSTGTSPHATPTATASSVGEMKPIGTTEYAEDLRKIGLDPMKLPQLNKLAPEQARKVMPLIAKSLGVKCDACHDMNAEMSTMTPRMRVAEHMWNDFVRIRTISTDAPVFCDACHHGSLTFLDRHDRPALDAWMKDAGTCKSCHGDPPRWLFIEGWKSAKK